MSLMRCHGTDHPVIRLQDEMNKIFHQFFSEPFTWGDSPLGLARKDWVSRLNVEETDQEYIIQAEVPGIDLKDVEVQLQGNKLTIKGEKKSEEEKKDRRVHIMEWSYGSFQRSLVLPEDADLEHIKATSNHGVLEISVAKKAKEQPRVIKVETK